MNRPPLPEPVRVLRHEMHCGMGISAYLLTDFTVKPMSPQQADKMGYWKHDKHPSPLAEIDRLTAERDALREVLQFIAGHDLNGADDRARAIICGLFIIKAKTALQKAKL